MIDLNLFYSNDLHTRRCAAELYNLKYFPLQLLQKDKRNYVFKVSDGTDTQLAKMTRIQSYQDNPQVFGEFRGENLITFIPPHPKINAITKRLFVGPTTQTLENVQESEYLLTFSPYIEGKDLHTHWKDNDFQLPLKEVIELGIQIGEALSHLHALQIAYRDLKPENIILKPDGTITLVDFETAKSYGRQEPLSPRGTRIYRAPEVWNRELFRWNYLDRVDSFSFGFMLHCLHTSNGPFLPVREGDTIEDMLTGYSLEADNFRLSPTINPAFGKIIVRLCLRDPRERATVAWATAELKNLHQQLFPS